MVIENEINSMQLYLLKSQYAVMLHNAPRGYISCAIMMKVTFDHTLIKKI